MKKQIQYLLVSKEFEVKYLSDAIKSSLARDWVKLRESFNWDNEDYVLYEVGIEQ